MMNSSQLRLGATMAPSEGERKNLNSELWHACAGPLVSLPAVGTRVVYFPQGHSEQVAASTQKEVNAHIPNYPNLPPQLVCQLHDVILHADLETDEVYCQMILQPVNLQERESFFVPDIGSQSRQPSNFFCKTLTASDTSTHGGFSIPRRAAEKVFPPLDYTQQPPAQELVTRDLHDTEWKFRHIYRGQPKRHLLTTGWSVFVSAKRLTAGDAVLFIRNEKGHLFLGIRRANRPPTALPSSVLSSDSMHIGVLAAAAHAASTNIRFTVFYNPRASPSDFVISHSKYEKAVYHTRVSVGMRFRMLFETEESSVRRYMGTITGIGDLDPVRWPNSQWRSIKVGWDESTAGERQRRVSLWEIEPLTAFLVYPPSSNWRFKHPWPQPISGSLTTDVELETLKKSSLWMQFQGINGAFPGSATQGLGGPNPLLGSMQQRYDAAPESDVYDALGAAALQEIYSSKQLHFQHPPSMQPPDQMLYRAQLHPHHHQSPFFYLPQEQQQHQQQQQQTQRPFSSQQQMPAFQSAAAVPFSMQGDRKNSIFSQQPSPYGPARIERQVQQLHQHPLKQSHQAMQAVLPVQDQPQQAVHHTGQQQQVQVQQSQPALLQSSHSLQQQQQQQQQQQSSLLQSPNQQPQHSLPQAYFPLFQPQTHATQPEQIHQQHLLSFPNAGNSFINQLPSPQQQTACSSLVGMPQLTSTEPPSTLASSTTGFQSSLQSILGNFVTDTSPLHSNAVPSVQPILRSGGSEPLQDPLSWHPAATHVSTSGFQAEATIPAVYTAPQTDSLGLTKLSTTGLPSSPFGFRECPSEQDDLQSDLHRQTLFAVDDGLPSLAIPTMSPGLRSTNNGINEFRCMQGQSSASLDLPCSPDAFVEGPEDNGFSQQFPDLALPVRTYTKVYKMGSVGRSIDVTRFRNYEELREEVARLFGLEGQFEDPRSGWQLIFVDKENDWLLVGDDPWEEFITNVRSIRIVSPFDGSALTQDGVGSHAGFVSQRQASSSSEDGCIQQDPRRRSPAITSTCSLNY